MLSDRYDLALSTASPAARDAYVAGADLLLALYPGAVEAFERAIEADPGFALAHAGKAQVLLREGKVAPARAALAAAKALNAGLTEREASHIAFLDRLFAGQAEAALAALRAHLATWPRDALALTTTVTPNGLIGASGRIGQKHEIAALMDHLAPHYGDDWWFTAHHGMALAEDGRQAAGRPKVERSMLRNPRNANGAHALAHVCYEEGETDAARGFLAAWLADYPRDGFFHGHLSWHLALVELAAGDAAAAFRLRRDAFGLDRHSGPPQQRMTDATSFLWRSELAGQPRDAAAWRAVYEFSNRALPLPSNGLADLHVILARAVLGDAAGLAERARQIEELAREGRYPSGPYLPTLARGFAAFEKRDFPAAIDALEPFAGQSERIGGSRAQLDLVEFTLLKAYLEAGRLDKARHLLGTRRPGPSGVPVAGVATVH
jgi:tetratricopeptide (TPR) repeat protein